MGNGVTKDRDDSVVFSFEYTEAGIYVISVFGFNTISNATSSVYITIQDKITGFELMSSINPMVPNTTFKIHWNIAKGMDLDSSMLHITFPSVLSNTSYFQFSNQIGGCYDFLHNIIEKCP